MVGQESAPAPAPLPPNETSHYFVFPEKKISLHRCDTSKTLVEIAKSSYVHINNENLFKDVREFSLVFLQLPFLVWLLFLPF
jgi:hypothetical protein